MAPRLAFNATAHSVLATRPPTPSSVYCVVPWMDSPTTISTPDSGLFMKHTWPAPRGMELRNVPTQNRRLVMARMPGAVPRTYCSRNSRTTMTTLLSRARGLAWDPGLDSGIDSSDCSDCSTRTVSPMLVNISTADRRGALARASVGEWPLVSSRAVTVTSSMGCTRALLVPDTAYTADLRAVAAMRLAHPAKRLRPNDFPWS
jgi:hypothetical protein